MEPEIVVIVASIAFGMVLLLVRPRAYILARQKFAQIASTGRAFFASLKDLARPWSVALLLYGLILVGLFLDSSAVRGGLPQVLLFFGVVATFVVFWFRELLTLMALRDDDLPGRFDKPIWAALLILMPPVGLVAFRCHRAAHLAPEPAAPHAKPRPTVDYGQELA